MSSIATSLITFVYMLVGPAMSLAYIPQALTVARDTAGAKSISLPTWGMWSFAASVTSLYSGFVVKDMLWCLSACGSMVGCWAVFGIAYVKRTKHARLTVQSNATLLKP